MTNKELADLLYGLKNKITQGRWQMNVDDTGDWLTGGYPSIWNEEADTSIIHINGFKQEYWESDSLKKCLANAEFIVTMHENLNQIIEALLNQKNPDRT